MNKERKRCVYARKTGGVLEQFANEMSELLWRLQGRRPLAGSFCQYEALQNMKHFNNKMLQDGLRMK